MSCDPPPRSVDEGLDWFLSHNPSGSGMCAQHTWHSLGGDRGCPPAWGCVNANQVYDKVKASGRYWTTPKRGDIAVWKYGKNGHAARVYDDAGTQIATTDPSNGKMVGVEPIGYPAKWGATSSARIFTDTYNGIKCFESGEPAISHGDVYLSKLTYGQMDSDSVKRLQMHLNAHPLENGATIQVTGNYLEQTDHEVRLCQTQHGFGSDGAGLSNVGPQQAEHLFTNCECKIIDDVTEEPEPPDPEEPVDPPEPPETIEFPLGVVYHYSGKPGGTFTFSDTKKFLDVATWAPPADGYTFGMLYANVDIDGEFRSFLERMDPSDETAFQTHYGDEGGDNCLLTHVWFEAGEGGRRLRYGLYSMDGQTGTVGTRYVKFLFIPKTAIIDLGQVLGAYRAARTVYDVARPLLPKVALAALIVWVLREVRHATH